jgi:phosphoribosylformylglycinamidine cyclo-ligase
MLCMGAKPLFFLDYIGAGRKELDVLLPLVSGVVEGCKQSDCALLGGETAEMPGMYRDGDYDIAGFGVGVVDRARVLKGVAIRPGHVIIGLESSGVHSNGYSLVRRIIKKKKWRLGQHVAEFGRTLGEELLEPTLIYVRPVISALNKFGKAAITGIANITGGGMVENIPRVLPANCAAVIDTNAWQVPAVFQMLQMGGNVARAEMFHVFNMGIGMVLICPPKHAAAVMRHVQSFKHKHARPVKARVIGEIKKGRRTVSLA